MFPQKIEFLEKRFGNIAVELGFITSSELAEALKTQVQEEFEKGKHRLIGQILFERGAMSTDQINVVLSKLYRSEKHG